MTSAGREAKNGEEVKWEGNDGGQDISMFPRQYVLGRFSLRVSLAIVFAVAIVTTNALVGCTGQSLIFGPLAVPEDAGRGAFPELAVAVAQPAGAVTASPGVFATIQWADLVSVPGTSVRVIAQRENNLQEPNADPIHLIGDGTVGSGRDALADGDSDIFTWDITGVRVGDYVITVILESPDGATATAVSRDADLGTTGVITVVTALAVPALTFNAPGATDVTVTTGNTFDITWTDNGDANADALLTLGLDVDADHASGNEIVLLRDDPLSNDGTNGTFTFAFTDENGDPVPDGTYTVFASLDDNANDIVTVEAVGRLILNP